MILPSDVMESKAWIIVRAFALAVSLSMVPVEYSRGAYVWMSIDIIMVIIFGAATWVDLPKLFKT